MESIPVKFTLYIEIYHHAFKDSSPEFSLLRKYHTMPKQNTMYSSPFTSFSSLGKANLSLNVLGKDNQIIHDLTLLW